MNNKETIEEAISFAILDGQNQIHDLKDGKATALEIEKRMKKSYDFHLKEIMKAVDQEKLGLNTKLIKQ